LKILLGRSPILAAPHYFQFDPYRYLLRRGKLRGGNRNPVQRLKRWLARRKLVRLGWDALLQAPKAVTDSPVPTAVP
jgi:hypothetical protein